MDRFFLAVARPDKTVIYLLNDGEILETREHVGSFADAARVIKTLIQRYRLPREIFLLLESDAQYYRFFSDTPRNKKDIAAQLNLKETDLWGYNEYAGEQYLYHVLNYKQETLNFYLQSLKKQEIVCKAIVPIDFLVLQNGQQGTFVTHSGDDIFFKIFDGQGSYYVKKFRNENQFLQHCQKILMYLKREKIVQLPDYLPERFKECELNSFILDFPRCYTETWSVYSEKKAVTKGPKIILKTQHKAVLGFLLVICAILAFTCLYECWQVCKLKNDIGQYQKKINVLAGQATRLREQEEDTRYFRLLNSRYDPLVRLTSLARTNRIEVTNLLQVDRQKPIALIGTGQLFDRDKFIKDLQKLKEFRSVTLIYANFRGLLVEFKLILAEK